MIATPPRLSDQLCFPFYAITRELQARYRPLLEPLGLTYPQYLVMLALWEHGPDSVIGLAKRLHLDSATLTPMLKRLEAAGLLVRSRDAEDNRILRITLSPEGEALQARAADIPRQLVASFQPGTLDLRALKAMLDDVLRMLEPT
ncbi:MAG TPA: MarR family transcriptional regulator [Myxococcota bacterium]|nr:MarR family transcriptional regulator [Myxococcota bacterium]